MSISSLRDLWFTNAHVHIGGKNKSIAERANGGEQRGDRRVGKERRDKFHEFLLLSLKVQSKWKRKPEVKWHPLSSFLHPFPPFSPFLAVGCCVEDSNHIHQTHVLWSLCLSAPDVSCVAVFSERLETQREALRPAGIVSSDKWRLKVLGGFWLCFCLTVQLVRPLLIDTVFIH